MKIIYIVCILAKKVVIYFYEKGAFGGKMRTGIKKIISTALCLIITVSATTESGFAALTRAGRPTLQKTFQSSNTFTEENLIAEARGRSLYIDFNTAIKADMFKLSLYEIGSEGGDLDLNILIEPEKYSDDNGNICYRFSKKLNMGELGIADGNYYLFLKRAVFEDENRDIDNAKFITISKNLELKVIDGSPYITVYRDVKNHNKTVRNWAKNINRELYLDNSLQDIRFVLRDPMTRIYAEMYEYKQEYIKSVADRICAGAKDNYEKIKRIYEYTASNFYYDIIAFREKSLQYADPYESIYNFENKLSSANSQRGIVHITCQGYSAIFIALARSQGIPSRLIFGHHLSVPSNNWTTEEYKMDKTDHWWAEAYVNGRWVIIDCTTGTTNQYNKSLFSIRQRGLTNYTFFDPSFDLMAMGHIYKNVYPDFRKVRYLTNTHDIDILRKFYNMNGNGRLLKREYEPDDLSTWGDNLAFHSFNDGWGNIANLLYRRKGLSGEAELTQLKSLARLDLRNNKFVSLDLSGSSALRFAKAYGNPLKKAVINIGGFDRKISSGENGSFSFNYTKGKNKPLIIYAKPELGYKVDGLYSLTTGTKNIFKRYMAISPNGTEFELRFKPDPDSYLMTVFRDGNSAETLPYIRAAAKMLSKLGYYSPYYPAAGDEVYYTGEMAEAVYKFQVVNGLDANYNIDEETWRKLFGENAVTYVGETEYRLMLEVYLKALEEAAAAEAALAEQAVTEVSDTELVGY